MEDMTEAKNKENLEEKIDSTIFSVCDWIEGSFRDGRVPPDGMEGVIKGLHHLINTRILVMGNSLNAQRR